jgi:peptide/nickel transport system substrate-binding protein
MRAPVSHRLIRLLAGLGLAGALLLPALAVPARAADEKLVLRVGTSQDLDAMNPFNTALVVGFEVFTLNYDLLVNWGGDLEPVPGFAESWTQSEDGLTWTFKIKPDMKWSDGTPATSEDARWTLQFVLDGVNSEAGYISLGYIDYYIANAGVTEITAPDPTTLVLKTDRPNTQVLQMYIPILPKHVWQDQTLDTVADFTNDVPIVGTGPYQAMEWKKGQYVRFEKNPNWTGPELAADEVFIQIFKDANTQFQAFRSGELDYASVNGEQLDALKDEPNVVTVAGVGNGFTELGFNTYSKPIEGGGASTKALQDPAFRDAIGYAIDKQLLVEKALKGYGEVGSTHIPTFQTKWHVEPTTLRTFGIDTAKQKLLDAGYVLDGEGRRLDKEGQPLNLRLYMPDSEEYYATSAQFVQDWLSQLGIKATTQVFDSGTLTTLMLPPEAGEEANKADFDLFIWGWGGDVDPNSLLEIFNCSSIGSTSDSMYCNPRYDELFDLQNKATSDDERKGYMAEMQQMIYDDAPYHVLFYDATTIAYRTDRFTGWKNQPSSNGVPLFGYGSYGYWQLKAVSAETPAPSATGAPAASGEPTPAPSAGGDTGGGGTDNTALLAAGAVAIGAVVLIGAIFLVRRRSGGPTEEE